MFNKFIIILFIGTVVAALQAWIIEWYDRLGEIHNTHLLVSAIEFELLGLHGLGNKCSLCYTQIDDYTPSLASQPGNEKV